MRKKIPTITRPDPTYSAALRQDVAEIPERGEVEAVASVVATPTAVRTETPKQMPDVTLSERPDDPARELDSATVPAESSPITRSSPPTRKIDVRVNALVRHEAALEACGVDPAHVVRAALRRAVKGWQLQAVYMPPSEERRTRVTQWQARTSLAVSTESLRVLLRERDPLDVMSKWALIRGQVEPRVWVEIDAVLEEIEKIAALPQSQISGYGVNLND